MTGDESTQPVEEALTLSDLADDMDEGSDAEGLADQGEEQEPELEETEGEEEQPDEPEEDDPTVTLKHDGKELSFKQSEVIDLAQKGLDYTKKTMAVAEERKAVEAERATVGQLRQASEQRLAETEGRLHAFVQFMESWAGEPPPAELASRDLAAFVLQKEQYQERKGQLDNAYRAIQAVQAEAQRHRQAQIEERANATEKALRDTLPDWSDERMHDLARYLGSNGISPESAVEAFVNEGVWKLADKAKKYDALIAQKATLKPKTELPKVQKPSAGAKLPSKADARQADALKRHREKPSIESLADLMD